MSSHLGIARTCRVDNISVSVVETVALSFPPEFLFIAQHGTQSSATLMFQAFVSATAMRFPVARPCPFTVRRKSLSAACRPYKKVRPPKAMLGVMGSDMAISLIVAEQDVTGRIFLGGIGIMLSGIVGVFVVFLLIKDKLDVVSASQVAKPQIYKSLPTTPLSA